MYSLVQHLSDGRCDRRSIVTAFVLELFGCAVLHNTIRDPQDAHRGFVTMEGLEFQDGRAESTCHRSILYGENAVEFLEYFKQQRFVQRFGKTHVVMRRIQAGSPEFPDGGGNEITRMTQAQDSDAHAVFDLSAFADADLFERGAPFRHYTFTARIADHEWSVDLFLLSGIKQVAQLAFVHR